MAPRAIGNRARDADSSLLRPSQGRLRDSPRPGRRPDLPGARLQRCSAQDRAEGHSPDPAEVASLKAAIDRRFKALITVAPGGALRFGEATELRRKDVTKSPKDRAVIRVERAVVHTKDSGAIVGPPKSAAGVRAFTLGPADSDELFTHLKDHVGRAKESLLFPAKDGGHLAARLFAPYRRAAGRPDLGFHALRHYSLTLYAAQPKASPAVIMKRAGHSTVSAAMTYQHAAAELAAEIAVGL